MKPDKPTQGDANQGEGNRVAARNYNKRARKFAASGQVGPAAHDAEKFVDTKPEQAARAERKAKRGPQPTKLSVDELVAKGRNVVDRLRPIVDRTLGRLGRRLRSKRK